MTISHSVFPNTAQINGVGNLVIGGCDTKDLANEYGTPLYVFDEQTIRERCRTFTSEFQILHKNTTIAYASKAYINPSLARIFIEEGLGLDVVSGGELAVAISADFPRSKVYFHGNNKSVNELKEALSWGIGRVVVDSFHELDLLNKLAEDMDMIQNIMVRVSPSIDPHTHAKTTTGVLDSKFGFSIDTGDAERAILSAINAPNLKLMGIHFHLGSPIFELDPYKEAMELVIGFAARYKNQGFDLEEISPGGGFAIAYTKDDIPPTVADYASAIVNSMNNACSKANINTPKLTIEPGRAITGPAGVALYTVGAIKDIPNIRKYVSVDGGMGDNIRPALYEATYTAEIANKMNQISTEKVTIAGKYCESGDILVKDIILPQIEPGDIIAIPASGAYCPSMASTYNLNPRPPMVMVYNGNARLIRRRESYQDIMTCDVV